jgi:hypothetical protein
VAPFTLGYIHPIFVKSDIELDRTYGYKKYLFDPFLSIVQM